MMIQEPPTGGVAVHPSMMGQQQQHQPQPTTTSTADQEEEDEEEELFRRLWIGEKKVRTLWIGDLQHWMDEAYIHRCFAHTGEVFTCKVIHNNTKTTTECYGFIEFKSHAIAARFLNKFNGTPMPRVAGGSSFSLNWASSSEEEDCAADDLTISVVGDDASSSSSFGSGGEQQRQEEDDGAADDLTISVVGDDTDLAASDIVTKTYTSLKHVDGVRDFYYDVSSCWEDMLIWWRIARGTRTLQAVHAAHRVYMIGAIFKIRFLNPPETVIEESLDELPRYVDIMDIAKELHSINALNHILGELYNQDAVIRAKAAKLINTMAKKNHSCWQHVNEASRARLIYHTYFAEHDPTVQSNALDAISSLVSNGTSGISAFGRKGYADLIKYEFKIGPVNHLRKGLNLIARLVEDHNSDYSILIELEYPSIIMRLATSDDAEVRKAAFRCLIVLLKVEKGENSGQVVKNDDKLKQILEERIEGVNAMAPEDLAAVSDERHLLDLLWNACHNEPSPL